MAKAATAKPAGKAPSKSEVLANIATATGLAKKDVAQVIDALGAEIKKALGKKGPGVFAVPGLVKIVRQNVPAKPARKGIDPFTKQERMFAAKPATVKVKVRALKSLKDMVK